ncbi:hypothetical protein WA158_004274 [Blastocystis sp. Blastoise]
MKHLAAYLLLVLGGNTTPSADNVKTLLESVGIESNEDQLNNLIKNLEGKNLEELIAAGSEKLASVPSGAAAAAPAAGAASAAAPAEEEKKEEEEEEEEDLGGAGGLFGGDDDDDW